MMTPTLVTSCTALPPVGASPRASLAETVRHAWGGLALRLP